MQYNIKDFITANYNEILAEALLEGLVILDTYNVNDHEFPLQNLMYGSVDRLHPEETLDRVCLTIRNFLVTLGRNFGVEFFEEVSIYDLVTFFKTLIDTEHYLDHDSILRAIESGLPDLETLAVIYEIIANIDNSWIFTVVQNVDPGLVVKIQENHLSNSKVRDDAMLEGQQVDKIEELQIKQLKLYREFTANDKLVCFKLLRRGNSLANDFRTNVEFIRNHLEFGEEENMVQELLGILLFSKDTVSDPIMGFKNNSEYLFDDLKKITSVNTTFNKLVSNFLNFKSKETTK